jgi:hypothetical protein
MRIIVTGLECSGTKWMTELLGKHPDVSEVVHTSIPEYLMCHSVRTRWPTFRRMGRVVWMIRYEPFRLQAVERAGYNAGRAQGFLPPDLYRECVRIYESIRNTKPPVMVSYAGLVSPYGELVFRNVLDQLSLSHKKMPVGFWNPTDANQKYSTGCTE